MRGYLLVDLMHMLVFIGEMPVFCAHTGRQSQSTSGLEEEEDCMTQSTIAAAGEKMIRIGAT